MSRRKIKMLAASRLYTTRPHPFVFTLLYVIITQALELISLETGGQPFVMDLDAAAAGDAVNAIQFAPENVTLKSSLILFLIQIMAMTVWFGYLSYSLHAVRGQKASLYDIMDGFSVLLRAILISVITSLLSYIGFMLLIVPGFIVLYTYSQAPLLLLDHPDWSSFRCLRESRRYMRGHKREYFMLRLSLLGWHFLCLFPVTSVFARPYATFCESCYYLYLTGELSDNAPSGPSTDEKPPWEY